MAPPDRASRTCLAVDCGVDAGGRPDPRFIQPGSAKRIKPGAGLGDTMTVRECDRGIISNKSELYNTQALPVAAGQRLERGMLVTCNGPVRAAGRGAKWYTVGAIEIDCDSTSGPKIISVFGSGAVTCVRVGADIRADQVGLKAWDHGSVARSRMRAGPTCLLQGFWAPARSGRSGGRFRRAGT